PSSRQPGTESQPCWDASDAHSIRVLALRPRIPPDPARGTVWDAWDGETANCLDAEAYSITSSARARNDGGRASPISRAVPRLTTSSKRVGYSIGRSPGLAPFRILATKPAERRYMSAKLGPSEISPPSWAKISASQIDGRRWP